MGSNNVTVNGRTVVHAKSEGVATAFPDVCLTPTSCGPVPIPYPNVALSKDLADGSVSVKANGQSLMLPESSFCQSTGDEAGSAGGVMSHCTKGKAQFVSYSFDVTIEGKGVPRMGDLMVHNKMPVPSVPNQPSQSVANTAPFPEVQPPASKGAGGGG